MNNIVEYLEAQKNYCKQNNLPQFSPEDGYCYSCGNNIYELISLEEASKILITGCPHCRRSFCD